MTDQEKIAMGQCVSPVTVDRCPYCIDICEASHWINHINETIISSEMTELEKKVNRMKNTNSIFFVGQSNSSLHISSKQKQFNETDKYDNKYAQRLEIFMETVKSNMTELENKMYEAIYGAATPKESVKAAAEIALDEIKDAFIAGHNSPSIDAQSSFLDYLKQKGYE